MIQDEINDVKSDLRWAALVAGMLFGASVIEGCQLSNLQERVKKLEAAPINELTQKVNG